MSILTEQNISSGWSNSRDLEFTDPFPDALREGESAKPGFGGYTYAADPAMALIFHSTPREERTSPVAGERGLSTAELSQGSNTAYGPENRNKMSNSSKTTLGEMARMINGGRAGGWTSEWATTGGGAKMALTFSMSESLRSLNDKSTNGRGTSLASGGSFAGFDVNNHYGISNWLAAGGAGTVAVEAAAAIEGQPARFEADDFGGIYTIPAVEAVAEVIGVEASSNELFRPTTNITTGLRHLPSIDSGYTFRGVDQLDQSEPE